MQHLLARGVWDHDEVCDDVRDDVVEHLGDPGDVLDGAGPELRAGLEARGVGYVLAVARAHLVPFGSTTHRVDALAARVPARAWQW